MVQGREGGISDGLRQKQAAGHELSLMQELGHPAAVPAVS